MQIISIFLQQSMHIHKCTGWRKKKLTCLICVNLKAKRAITRELRALHSVLSNLNFDIRLVHFRAILTERAAFKLDGNHFRKCRELASQKRPIKYLM